MSAFVVSHRHVDAIIVAGLHNRANRGPLRWLVPAPVNPHAYAVGQPWGPEAIADATERRRELTIETAGRVGSMLLAENRRSVDHRYDEDGCAPEDAYTFATSTWLQARPLPPVAILKALDCLEYQSCEHPGWSTSEAFAFVTALRSDQIGRLAGYDEAAWEVRT